MNEATQIDPHEIMQKLDAGPVTLVDIRDAESFAAGHPPGAVRLDHDNLQAFMAGADKSRPLVVFCYHGNSSQSAAVYFEQQGFGEVYSARGGFSAWQDTFPDPT